MFKDSSLSPSKNYGDIFIPKYIADRVREGELSLYEGALMSIISFFQKREGCFASNEYLSKYLGITVRRVQQILSGLIKRGMIKKRTGHNRMLEVEILEEDS